MASRKEQKERLKAERMERERQAQAAERRKRLVGLGAGSVLALAAIVALIVAVTAGGGDGGDAQEAAASGDFPEGSVPAQQIEGLDEAVRAANCELEDPEIEGNGHTNANVNYESNPPTSGDHRPVPADDGAYTEAPETEALVHSLEHGRIAVQYAPDAPDSVRGDLKALFDEDPYHMILTPNDTGMPYQVAATAWGHLLGCDQMSPQVFDAIRAFRDEYRDEGPEFVP